MESRIRDTDTLRWLVVVVGVTTFLVTALQLLFFAYPAEAPPLFSVLMPVLFLAQAIVHATWLLRYVKVPPALLDPAHLHSSCAYLSLPTSLILLGVWFYFLLAQGAHEAATLGQFMDPLTADSGARTFQRHLASRATLIVGGSIGLLHGYLLRPAINCRCGE